LEEKEMKPSCSISVSVLDQATQCSSVVVKKKSGRTGKTRKMKRGKTSFLRKPARRKAPKHGAIEEKVLF
jgi:hypothetical protein